jgi:hypothetical protein
LHSTPALKKQGSGLTITKQVPLLVVGQQGGALRVQTPGGRMGYVASQAIVGAEASPLRRVVLPSPTELLTAPAAAAPAGGAFAAQTQVEVLGQTERYSLLRGPGGETGWAIL